MSYPQNHVCDLMGVSGRGKSAVTCDAMLDGDYLHPQANINKMFAGHVLDDNHRAPDWRH